MILPFLWDVLCSVIMGILLGLSTAEYKWSKPSTHWWINHVLTVDQLTGRAIFLLLTCYSLRYSWYQWDVRSNGSNSYSRTDGVTGRLQWFKGIMWMKVDDVHIFVRTLHKIRHRNSRLCSSYIDFSIWNL